MRNTPTITKNEWRWVIGWSIAVVLLSCVPYLVVWLTTPPGWNFAGILVNPLDGQSYMAKMQQGAAGNWIFHLTYTPEAHDGAYIFLFYLGLGHLSALSGLSKPIVFHLARIAAAFFLLIVIFQFIARVTPRRRERRLAFALLICASGLGWLGALFGALPIDLWVPEAFVPYSLFANPHFPLGIALMLLIFNQVLDADSAENSARPPWLHLFIVGGIALALALILPFGLLTVWAVLAVFLAWQYLAARDVRQYFTNRLKIERGLDRSRGLTRIFINFLCFIRIYPFHPRRPRSIPQKINAHPAAGRRLLVAQIRLTLSTIVFAAPIIFYQYWVSTTNPILAGWGAQNVTDAPKILDFALGYGLVGLLAIAGGWLAIRQKKPAAGEWLVLLWAITAIILVYLPFFNLQRRLITGLHVPLSILATLGLTRWLGRSKIKAGYQRLIVTGVVAVSAFGTLFVWSLPLLGAMQSPENSETAALLFIRQDEQAAFDWLQQNSAADAVILASPRVGMFAPGQTGRRAYFGHPFETINAKAKRAQTEAFFRGETGDIPPQTNFIFYGPSEQRLGTPESLNHFPVAFSSETVTIYSIE